MYNDIRKCKACGKLFKPLRSNICPECLDKVEELFQVVRDYIYDNREADLLQIEKDTGVDSKLILEFIREGRISVSSENMILKCAGCGEPISEGEYCARCKSKLIKGLETVGNSYNGTGSKEDGASGKTRSAGMHINYNK